MILTFDTRSEEISGLTSDILFIYYCIYEYIQLFSENA